VRITQYAEADEFLDDGSSVDCEAEKGTRLVDRTRFLLEPEDICEPEWAAWYRLSPLERWLASEQLWADYLALGGTLAAEPDTQSPFFDADAPNGGAAPARAETRLIRRGGV
jgi:hypothetical protein